MIVLMPLFSFRTVQIMKTKQIASFANVHAINSSAVMESAFRKFGFAMVSAI